MSSPPTLSSTPSEPPAAVRSPARVRHHQNQRRIIWISAVLAAVWILATAAAPLGGPYAGVGALLLLGLGAGASLTYRTFLREADELRRKVELDALAVGAAVALIGAPAAAVLGGAGYIGPSLLTALLALPLLAYSVAVVRGLRSYA